MTNFELGVHIPLVIRVPWLAGSVGKETAVLAEMVDMFPTLSTLGMVCSVVAQCIVY
jgi:arylsulfatase A-like enzyme